MENELRKHYFFFGKPQHFEKIRCKSRDTFPVLIYTLKYVLPDFELNLVKLEEIIICRLISTTIIKILLEGLDHGSTSRSTLRDQRK